MYKRISLGTEVYRLGAADDPQPTLVHLRRASAEDVEVVEAAIRRHRSAVVQVSRDADDEDSTRKRCQMERAWLAGKIDKLEHAYEIGDCIEDKDKIAEYLGPQHMDEYAYGLVRATVRGQMMLTEFAVKA